MTVFRPSAARPFLFCALLALALLGAAACGEDESAPVDATTAAPAPADKPAPKPAAARPAPGPVTDATVTTEGLPDDFPSDFPIFPDAAATGAIGLGKGPMIASFTTAASVGDVVSFYDAALSKAGWSVKAADAKAGSVNAAKGRRSALVRVSASPAGTNIAVVLEGS